ncbi:MAG: hypothetical protein AB7U82_01060 [Blastocatellales bacterium]
MDPIIFVPIAIVLIAITLIIQQGRMNSLAKLAVNSADNLAILESQADSLGRWQMLMFNHLNVVPDESPRLVEIKPLNSLKKK